MDLLEEEPEPQPEPSPPVTTRNPYSVKDGWLLKDGRQVSRKNSPNVSGTTEPTLIVIHYTGDNGTGGLEWLCDPRSSVSASSLD